MKSTFISKENNVAKFTMEFTAEEFDAAVVKAYQENKEKFALDGFRKGKAPRKLIEAKFGEDVFYEEAVDQLFSDNYMMAITEHKLEVINRPMADCSELKAGQAFTITVEVECYPEVKVDNYKGIEIEKVEFKVGAADVKKELEIIQHRNARVVTVDRAAQNGDTVIVDYAGFCEGVQFDGGTAEMYQLTLGSGTFIPGFEDQLVGVAAGEEKDVVVTFPTEYHAANLAGKEATFKCKVHEVKTEELPELDDEFAKDVSEFDTLADYKKDIKKSLEKEMKIAAENEMKDNILKVLYESNNFDIPEIMIEDEMNSRLAEIQQQLESQNLTFEKYFEFMKSSMEDLKGQLQPECYKAVKTRLLVAAVAEAEGLTVDDEAFEKELEKIGAQYNLEVAQVKQILGPDRVAMMQADLRLQKAIDFMYDNAVIKAPAKEEK